MPEPITISAILTTAALTEGVKFLYGQASELLKRWRDRREAAFKEAASAAPATEPVTVVLPETVFAGQLSAPQIHFAELERLAEPMRQLWRGLGDYVHGIETVNPSDEGLLKIVDALRQTLEGIYQQRLTFQGEQRPASGPVVEGRVDVDRVLGRASGVVADVISGGAQVHGEAAAGTVEPGGDLAGVRANRIGS
jgi:hypothetical protein